MPQLNDNERSTVIDLISDVNHYLSSIDISIKRLGGESSLRTPERNRRFPDVILYGDNDRRVVLQNWEIKMPDVSIIDRDFVQDAQNKARLLGLNSFFIWNFKFGKLYVIDGINYIETKQWTLPIINTRTDVSTYRDVWLNELKSIILEINDYIVTGRIRKIRQERLLSENIPLKLIQDHKISQGVYLQSTARSSISFRAFISQWWSNMRLDFEGDEGDPYFAYAKIQILKWANRILFSHIIKHRYNPAREIDYVSYNTSAGELTQVFQHMTANVDFYSILAVDTNESIISSDLLSDLISFSLFVGESGCSLLDHSVFQQIMERTINTSKRAIGGQFATPLNLAKFLVKVTMNDLNNDVIDPCVGTGTIIREVLNQKVEAGIDPYESIWASDKYFIPLQLTHMSIIKDINQQCPIKVFQHNVFDLNINDTVKIINPQDGSIVDFNIPVFDTIVSNLPFVPFELIGSSENAYISSLADHIEREAHIRLSGKSDLFTFILFKLRTLISDTGRIGVITSNSWLGTEWGANFYNALDYYFHIENVIISGKGRWFQNADIVTTIIILSKKGQNDTPKRTSYALLNDSIDRIVNNQISFQQVVNTLVLKDQIDNALLNTSNYLSVEVRAIKSLGVSYNTLFHKVSWLDQIREKLVPITNKFVIGRGSRRGWNEMFYPTNPTLASEDEYLVPALKSPRNLVDFSASTDTLAFCCNVDIGTLTQRGHIKALQWIDHFSHVTNGNGVLLPTVLKQTDGGYWYSMKDNEKALMTTILNPNKRLFIGKFSSPTFIDQRFVSINPKLPMTPLDQDLYHALLNSILGMFYIEAVGFGRGLGVLDINSTSFSNIMILNGDLLTTPQKHEIIRRFRIMCQRAPLSVEDELLSTDRIQFDNLVFSSFNLTNYHERVKSSLISMHRSRLSVLE